MAAVFCHPAQAVLFGQWGFERQHGRAQGIAALFHGEVMMRSLQ